MKNKVAIIISAKDHTNKAFKGVRKNMKKVSDSVFSLKGALVGLTASFGLEKIASSLLDTAVSFENFETSLLTLTGSSEKAQDSMDWITEFTTKTPYELGQVSDAFVKLTAYGFDATKHLGMLGDTAASMGKGLNMAVEAFADAATGEFERLKEFGVKAKTAGDKVTFSWVKNGIQMEKTVKKTQNSITTGLSEIWSGRFQGGMERFSKSWSGMWSNLLDQFNLFKKDVMEEQLFENMKKGLDIVLKKVNQLKEDGDLKKWSQQAAKAVVDGFIMMTSAAETTLKSLLGLKLIYLEITKLAQKSTSGPVWLAEKISGGAESLGKSVLEKPRRKTSDKYTQFGEDTGRKAAEWMLKWGQGEQEKFNQPAWNAEKTNLEIIKTIEQLNKLKVVAADVKTGLSNISEEIDNQMDGAKNSITKTIEIINGNPVTVYSNVTPATEKIEKDIKNSITKTTEWVNGNPVTVYSNVSQATDKIKKDIRSSITETTQWADGHPVTVYSNVAPATRGLKQVQEELKKIKSKTITVHVKHTGEGSRTLPLSEKINEIIGHYGQIPSGMDFHADFSSLSQGFGILNDLQTQIKTLEKTQKQVSWVDYSFGSHLGQPHTFYSSERQEKIDSLKKQESAVASMLYNPPPSMPAQYSPAPSATGSGNQVDLNIGPVNINVSGTGGDRDLAITLADEIDREIAAMITHNRSEIVAALGLQQP